LRGKHLNSGIRGGLWEDEHLQRMGPAVWLFGWLVHRQTRERHGVGLVLGGSPITYQIISQDTGMAVRTLKRWMARLVRGGYVSVKHTAQKRMVIQIAKAKKFGPQQLQFPQEQFSFPQVPFFAPKSKGPLWALQTGSKGPVVAPEVFPAIPQAPILTSACSASARGYRENKPERKETESRPHLNPASSNGQASPSHTNRCKTHDLNIPGAANPSFGNPRQMRAYPIRYGADRKILRELEVLAELRVGAGPEIHRE
jgi:hypothetical protein